MNDTLVFNFIEVGQIDDLENRHRIIYELDRSSCHWPGVLSFVRKDPDVEDDFPCYFYVTRGREVVSSVAALPDVLSAAGEQYRWAWMGNLWTDPLCRGQGLASKVWTQASEVMHKKKITIAGAFANPVTTHMCRKLDFVIPERASRLLLLKSARPFLAQHLKFKPLVSLLDFCYQTVRSTYRLFWSSSRQLSRLTVQEVSPEELTNNTMKAFFSSLEYDDRWHFNDSAPKLAWKLPRADQCRLFIVSDLESSLPFMYLVVKKRRVKHLFADRYTDFVLMTLMDFGMTEISNLNYDRLLQVIEDMFFRSDAEILEVITSSPEFIKRARRRGHLKIGQGVAFWFKPPPGVRLPDDGQKAATWHFTHFRSDGFSFS